MTYRYPDGHPQREFDDHFEGVWERKWWAVAAASPIRVTSYRTGEITNALLSLHAVDDDGFDRYFTPRALRRYWRRRAVVQADDEGMATTRSRFA